MATTSKTTSHSMNCSFISLVGCFELALEVIGGFLMYVEQVRRHRLAHLGSGPAEWDLRPILQVFTNHSDGLLLPKFQKCSANFIVLFNSTSSLPLHGVLQGKDEC